MSSPTVRPTGALALVVSGLLGFAFGLSFRSWQDAAETAQVVAGLVHYPPDNPFFIYHVKLWTVLHQIGAVLLRLGVGEIALSTLLSGLIGQLSFQALTMTTFAISRRTWLSIGIPFLVLVSGIYDLGVIYPIMPLGVPYTYGAVGLSGIVLIVALLGSGWWRTGAFLLALMPAIHPSLGFWVTVIVALCVVLDWNGTRPLRAAWRWYAAGALLTAFSLGAQLLMMPALPSIAPAEAQRFLTQWVGFWDEHRRPVDLSANGVKMNVFVMVVALVFLWRWRADLPIAARFLLQAVVVAGGLGVVVAWATHQPPGRLPMWFLIAMPARVLNFDVLLAVPLLAGLLGRFERVPLSAWLLLVLSVVLLGTRRSVAWEFIGQPKGSGWNALDMVAVIAIGSLIVGWLQARQRASAASETRDGMIRLARWLTAVVLAIAGVGEAVEARRYSRTEPAAIFRDRTNERVFGMLGIGHGLVATGGDLHLIQLRTRRPVLIDGGGLDGLPYALEAAALSARILRDVYGIDYFNPPADARQGGRIPNQSGRAAWEKFTLQMWRAVRATYGVTEVVVPGDWKLDLPETASGSNVRLYAIPE